VHKKHGAILMAYISFQPSDFFNTVLYNGDGTSDHNVTGVGFQPDWVWIKRRDSAGDNQTHDSSRGSNLQLVTNNTNAESANANFGGIISDGFNLSGDGGSYNNASGTYASWNWKANGGTTSSNTDGSITSTVQANTTAGFSIVTYTGNATTGATVGHGLGVAPKIVLIKKRNSTSNWVMQNTNLNVASGDCLFLDTTDANTTISSYWNAVPTSTVFTLGNNSTPNGSGDTYVAYCFAEIKGYSNFGSYTGNGSSDGPFIYTGFRPAWILFKSSSVAGQDWVLMDAKRTAEYNPTDGTLYPNNNVAEVTTIDRGDILSNGYKLRNTSPAVNQSGASYVFMAFAEFPLIGSNGQVGTAR